MEKGGRYTVCCGCVLVRVRVRGFICLVVCCAILLCSTTLFYTYVIRPCAQVIGIGCIYLVLQSNEYPNFASI